MTYPRRRRYRVRLRRAVAGSFLAAATAASLTGFTAAPVLVAPPRPVAESSDYEAGDITLGLDSAAPVSVASPVAVASPVSVTSPITVASPFAVASGTTSSEERLAGVRADLDQSVLFRMVSPEQADGFYAQIERRVAAGL